MQTFIHGGGATQRFLATGGILLSFIVSFAAESSHAADDKMELTLKSVADWQLAQIAATAVPGEKDIGWVNATFYMGLARWATVSNRPQYFDAIHKLGQRVNWALGPRGYHADDHAIGQAYVASFDHYGDFNMIAPMTAQFDFVLANKPTVSLTFDDSAQCLQRWCWCDALFMAPASWMAISRITGGAKYREYADAEFWSAHDYLFDRVDHLFFRDSRFFDKRGPDNEKIFWGRGNGWVFAGLINILRELPSDHPSRPRYELLLKAMAERLSTLQRSDGFWATSLMSPPNTSVAEASATAFFTYGIASGIVLGLLERAQYKATALRGWSALMGSVDSHGRVGRVQQPSDRPGPVDVNNSEPYGSGAFLLAGTSVKTMLETSQNQR